MNRIYHQTPVISKEPKPNTGFTFKSILRPDPSRSALAALLRPSGLMGDPFYDSLAEGVSDNTFSFQTLQTTDLTLQ